MPPPTKLELRLDGKAKEEQSWVTSGTFNLENGLVNGYPHWLKTGDGSQAIWFDKVASNWKVSEKEDLGTDTGGIAGPLGKDSYPNEIKQGWRYADNTVGRFVDAGPNDIIFRAIGTFFKPLLHKITKFHLFPFTKQHLDLFKSCS